MDHHWRPLFEKCPEGKVFFNPAERCVVCYLDSTGQEQTTWGVNPRLKKMNDELCLFIDPMNTRQVERDFFQRVILYKKITKAMTAPSLAGCIAETKAIRELIERLN